MELRLDKKSKYEGKLQRIALSCDSFTTGYFAVSLLFAVWYVYMYGGVLVLGFLPIACLVPFAVMPFVYLLVHRVDILLFGRYHLVMPLSAFVAALFFVILYSSSQPDAGGACTVFFGTLVFVPCAITYRYCAFSVRARLAGDGIVTLSPYAVAFSLLGAVGGLAAFFGFWHYESATAFLNTAYVLGGVNVLLALIGYLTTYYSIPKLSGRRVLSVKTAFRTFYVGLRKRIYFSSLLFLAAFAGVVMTDMLYAIGSGASFWEVFAIVVVFVVSYAVTACVSGIKANRRSLALSIVNLASLSIGAIVPLVFAAIGSGGVVYAVAASVLLCGVGGAVSVRQAKLRCMTIKPHITSGVSILLFELTVFAAVAVAFAVCAVTAALFKNAFGLQAFMIGYAVCVALLAAAFALAGKKPQKSGQALSPSYDLDTTEIDRIAGQ